MIGALVRSMRPGQWTKNLLLFAGVLFSRQLGDPALLGRAAGGFAAFCLLSSAVYLMNDLRDVESDRRHPRKRLRPIASGELPAGVAWTAIVVLLAAVAGLSVWLGAAFGAVAAVYFVMHIAYSSGLKHVVLVDVFVVALGFVLRALAGVEVLLAVSPDTAISPWLLMCTFFGALFLALGKRRRELQNAGEAAEGGRAVLGSYTGPVLDGLLLVTAATSLMSYALYTIWPGTVAKFGTERLLWTVPIVAYGIFRYLYLVGVSQQAEDPSSVLLHDRPIGATVVLYLAAVLAILYWR